MDEDRGALRNVLLLAFSHGVLGSQVGVHIILGGLSGAILASNPALATVPISIMVVTTMVATGPMSLFMGRFGRVPGFLLGATAGTLGGLCCAMALIRGSFSLFLLGSTLIGVYQAANGYFRFAAADSGSPEFRPKAISWVLAGGLFGAFLTAEVVQATRDLMAPVPFAGTYFAFLGINLVGSLPLLLLRLKPPTREDRAARPALLPVLRRPGVVTAMLCGMASYAVMNLVMTSTPLAMVAVGCSPDQAADVVRWHILAMYLPSFFTGNLVARFGHIRIIGAGILLLGAAGATALNANADGLHYFYGALVLLGFGWNFAFIGATSLLTTCHTVAERARVQGLNDVLVFGLVAAASFSSGALLSSAGWPAVQLAMAPVLALAAISLAHLAATSHTRRWSEI